MPDDAHYTTGQVAEELGVSQERVRALCQAGKIRSVRMPGGQFRVSESELQRIKKHGLPPLPKVMLSHPTDNGREDDEDHEPPPPPRPEESPRVLNAIEETLVQRQRREALEHKVAILELERRKAETEDFFDARDREEAEHWRHEQERARIERQQKANRELLLQWEAAAIQAIPRGAPAGVVERVQTEIRRQLGSVNPLPSTQSLRLTVDAIVRTEAAPFLRQQEIDKLLSESREWLPWSARVRGYADDDPTWEKAARAEVQRIIQATPNAPIEVLRAEARQAVMGITEQFNHVQRCGAFIGHLNFNTLAGVTEEEKRAARRAIAEAIGPLPHGVSDAVMEKAAQEALTPFAAAIAARQEPAVRKTGDNAGKPATAAPVIAKPQPTDMQPSARRAAEQRASRLLTDVDRYVAEGVERYHGFNFYSARHKKEFIASVEPKLREALTRCILKEPTATDEGLRHGITKWLRDYVEPELGGRN